MGAAVTKKPVTSDVPQGTVLDPLSVIPLLYY